VSDVVRVEPGAGPRREQQAIARDSELGQAVGELERDRDLALGVLRLRRPDHEALPSLPGVDVAPQVREIKKQLKTIEQLAMRP